jgi:hypothetical protein
MTQQQLVNLVQRLTTKFFSSNRLGIKTTVPTASLHIGSGGLSPGTAPLKLTPGLKLTSPEDGTFEYDGTHLYFTIGTTRNTIV